jgi:hypothetical protein
MRIEIMVRHQLPGKMSEAARDWRKAGIASYNPVEATQFPNICRYEHRRGSTARGSTLRFEPVD